MPSRGYRKGVSDTKVPLGRRIHTRLPDAIHAALMGEAASRSTNAAKVLRELATARYTGQRLALPHHRAATRDAVYQFERIGQNLNQIARQGNLMRLHLVEADARRAIVRIHALLDELM